MTKTRRSFLRLAAAVAASPLFGKFSFAKETSGFHMVDGWILTDADVVALREFGL